MNITLIQPKHLRGPDRIFEPLSLGYIASFLRENGYKDISIHSTTFESDRKIIAQAASADIVGITAMSPQITHANILTNKIKRINPKSTIVLGGFHPTALPEATLRNKNIDFVVRGEGEVTFFELAEAVRGNKGVEDVAGISYRRHGRIVHNQPRYLIDDIDTIPYPSRELIGQEKFTNRYYQYLGERRATVLSTRGCPFSCRNCASHCVWTRRWRSSSVENTVLEIKELTVKYRVEHIDFIDAVFTLDKQRVLDFCRELISKRIKISWGCYVHATTVDEEMLRAMKSAGCRDIYVGVESATPSILEELRKGTSLEKIRNIFRIANAISLSSLAFFMIGFPEDDYDTIKETERLINDIQPTYVGIYILTPMPGCEYYEFAKQKGYLSDESDWLEIDWEKAIMPTRYLSIEDINTEFRRLRREFAYLSQSRRFSITHLLSKAWVEFKNTPICEFSFSLFKLWRYLRLTIFKNIFSGKSVR